MPLSPCVFSVDGTDIPALGAALVELDVAGEENWPSRCTAAFGATLTGLVECDTLKANAVIAKSYTPGAGNVW